MNTTHPLNVSYLVMGLIFLGISGTWALVVSGAVDIDWTGYLLPLTLVAAGVVGLAASAVRGLGRRRQAGDEVPGGHDTWDTGHDTWETGHDTWETGYTRVLPSDDTRGENR